jgi:xanthine dehydrogenase YagR molybdenum-binding subunit
MASYIGTPTSRVDGRAKVTGATKYAGEFNATGLAYGSVVESTIPRGRIVRIDTSDALRVEGVLDVLTHENRPRMAGTSHAYKDDVAPEGSPFRPLYDAKIMFSGQPIALVLAEEWEIARYAASLVRVEYETEAHVTDLYAQRDQAFVVEKPERPRGDAERAYAAADACHEAEYYIPIEHHNPMELFASTVTWDGDGKLTVYDKTQGVQNVQRYLCSVFDMKSDEVRVMSPFVGGAFGAGLRPQYQVVLAVLAARALERSVRLVLTRQQMYVLGYRPATIERLALGAKSGGTLDAITHEAIAITSQYEEFARNDTGWSGLLYKCANASYVSRGWISPRAATCARQEPQVGSMRSNARWTNSPSRSNLIHLSCACGAIRTATSTKMFRIPARSSANATFRARKPSAGTSASPRRGRCATAANWSAGAWRRASGRRCRWRPPCVSC